MNGPLEAPSAKERERGLLLLERAPYAYVAVVEKDRPYAVPMNYACDPQAGLIYLHTGRGRKSAALDENPRVCIVIAADAAFDRGPTPCNDGFAFRSTVVEGRALLLEDPVEREAALRTIVAKYDPDAAAAPFDADVLAQTLVYAVDMETVSYRQSPRSGG